jgi:hypothetical protein
VDRIPLTTILGAFLEEVVVGLELQRITHLVQMMNLVIYLLDKTIFSIQAAWVEHPSQFWEYGWLSRRDQGKPKVPRSQYHTKYATGMFPALRLQIDC